MARLLVLGVLAWLAQPTGAWAEPAPPRFSHPDGPDRAEIEFRSSGCFYERSTSIVIFRNPPYARVADGKGERWVPLSVEDLSGLDHLFDFYRARPRFSCTYTDEARVTWFRGDAKLVTEQFEDSSCLTGNLPDRIDQVSPEDRQAVAGITLTLEGLVRRAAE